MIILSLIKHRRLGELGDDVAIPHIAHLGHHFARCFILLRAMRENHRAVLCADVITLTIEGGRIMDGKKYFENVTVANDSGIKFNPHHLGMAGVALADLRITRIQHTAAAVTGLNFLRAVQHLINRVEAPEAAASECGNLCRHVLLRFKK